MWRRILAERASLEPRLPLEWRTRLAASIQKLQVGLGESKLDVCLAHRDFAPWNTRVFEDGRLFVFDWELSEPETTPLYDLFHFLLVDHVSIRRRAAVRTIAARLLASGMSWATHYGEGMVSLLFLAYLVDRALSRLTHSLWRANLEHDRFLHMIGALLDSSDHWMPGQDRK
jgi:hypothetical protein